MKKTLAILLVLMLALSLLAACGSKTETPAPEPEVESVEPAAEETAEEPAEEPEEEPAEEPAEEPEEEPAEEPVEEPEEEPAGEPSGEPTEEPAEAPEAPELSGVIVPAGEYTYTENTPFGAYPWVLTLNEDGTYSVMQDNPDMGSPTWTGDQWVDNGDGTFTVQDCVGDGPQIASFWKNNSITFTLEADGSITPVG